MVSFRDEPINGPSIPELSFRPNGGASLGVSFCNMDSFNSESFHQQCPFTFSFGLWFHLESSVIGKIDKCLLDKPAYHARVGSTARNSSSFSVVFPHFLKEGFSKTIVGSGSKVQFLIGIVSFPLFLDSVDIKHTLFLAVLHDLGWRCANGEVDTEVNFTYKDFIEDLSEVLSSKTNFKELDVAGGLWKVYWIGINDGHVVNFKVFLNHRHSPLPDRSMSNDTDVVYLAVNLLSFHC